MELARLTGVRRPMIPVDEVQEMIWQIDKMLRKGYPDKQLRDVRESLLADLGRVMVGEAVDSSAGRTSGAKSGGSIGPLT